MPAEGKCCTSRQTITGHHIIAETEMLQQQTYIQTTLTREPPLPSYPSRIIAEASAVAGNSQCMFDAQPMPSSISGFALVICPQGLHNHCSSDWHCQRSRMAHELLPFLSCDALFVSLLQLGAYYSHVQANHHGSYSTHGLFKSILAWVQALRSLFPLRALTICCDVHGAQLKHTNFACRMAVQPQHLLPTCWFANVLALC